MLSSCNMFMHIYACVCVYMRVKESLSCHKGWNSLPSEVMECHW